MKHQIKKNYTVFFPPIFALFYMLPYWSDAVLPLHDTLYKFQVFYFFYNEFYQNQILAFWVPYGFFGLKALYFQLTFLTPADYLCILIGYFFGVENVLLLFKVSFLLNILIYASGLQFLLKVLKFKLYSEVILLATFIGFVSWIAQPFFNFFTFYLVPWILGFILLWISSRDEKYIFLAATTGALSFVGNAFYISIILFYILALFIFSILIIEKKTRYLLPKMSWLRNPFFGLAIFFLVLVPLAAVVAMDGIIGISPGREHGSYFVSLEQFLNYGRVELSQVIAGYFAGSPFKDNSYFIGWIPVFLAIIMLANRNVRSISLASMMVFICLFALSIGGVFAEALYRLPGMNFYRHIGLLYGVASLFLFVASAVFIEKIDQNGSGEQLFHGHLLALPLCLALIDLFISHRAADFTALNALIRVNDAMIIFKLCIFVLLLAAFLWTLRRNKDLISTRVALKKMQVILIFLWFMESMIFYKATITDLPKNQLYSDNLFYTQKFRWHEQRTNLPQSKRYDMAKEVVYQDVNFFNASYSFFHNFADWDACYPQHRIDFLMEPLMQMLKIIGANPNHLGGNSFNPQSTYGLELIACQTPKIRSARNGFLFSFNGPGSDEVLSGASVRGSSIFLEQDMFSFIDVDNLFMSHDAEFQPSSQQETDEKIVFDVVDFNSNTLSVKLSKEMSKPQWLIFASAFDRGWTAFVDGLRVDIYNANIGLIGLRVPIGAKEITLKYQPFLERCLAWILASVGILTSLIFLLFPPSLAFHRELRS